MLIRQREAAFVPHGLSAQDIAIEARPRSRSSFHQSAGLNLAEDPPVRYTLGLTAFSTRSFLMAHEQFQSCIKACNDCANECDHCVSACCASGSKELARCIQLGIDCAAICRVAVGAMARGGEAAAVICGACAEVCDLCADECDKHKTDECRRCAEACRRCAQECRRMSSGAQGARKGEGTGAPAH